MTVLFVSLAIWAGLLVLLTVYFDVWVYLDTKNFDFVLNTWMNRHKTLEQHLLPRQAALLKVVSLVERGLGYFGLFVVIPLYALLILNS